MITNVNPDDAVDIHDGVLWVEKAVRELLNKLLTLFIKFCSKGAIEGIYLHNLPSLFLCFLYYTSVVSPVAFHTHHTNFDCFWLFS